MRVIFCVLAVLLAAILPGCDGPVVADVVVQTMQVPQGGAKGLVIDRPAIEPYACGLVWEQAESPVWVTGLDISQDYPGVPDLVLAYNPATASDELRIRADTGSLVLGPRIGHPNSGFQLQVEPHGQSGLIIGTDSHALSAYFYNHGAPHDNRTSLDFQNLWLWATDRGEVGGTDLCLYDLSSQQPVIAVDQGARIGFLGAAPVARPVVAGSWGDGTAAKSVLAALVRLGLAADQTTP